jgi:hypothetical protein
VQKKATRRGVGQNVGVGINDKGVPADMGNYQPYSKRNGTAQTQGYNLQRGILSYREISNGTDLMNLQGPMDSTTQTAKVGTLNKSLDEIDFIRLKFGSTTSDRYAYFRGTISGYSESYSPSYGQHQGIGMAYPLYTFESIERTLQFNFKAYSLSLDEHIACWERLQYLASLTMPQSFTANEATNPPIIKFWLGDMFDGRYSYIENLTYTTDVNFPWEIGLNSGSKADCYKLPMIIDISVTIHFIENMEDTISGDVIYDFWKVRKANVQRTNNPAVASAIAAQNQPQNLPAVTVTSSPKKKILPATTIPTLPSKPIKLADVNIPKTLPTIPNIQPLESSGNKIGGAPVTTNESPQSKISGETVPTTPNVPSDVAAITNTPIGTTNSTDKKGEADLPKYDVKRQFGDIAVLGKGTAKSDTLAMMAAEYNAVKEARVKLAVPGGSYNINVKEVRGDSTHLYLNKDGTYTYESKYNVQILDKRTKSDVDLEKEKKEFEAEQLKNWKSEN